MGSSPLKHVLKIDPVPFQDMLTGKKLYELRKDDRNYQVGDVLHLRETRYPGVEMATGAPLEYTGREEWRLVAHILRGPLFGLQAGWAILSCPERVEER